MMRTIHLAVVLAATLIPVGIASAAAPEVRDLTDQFLSADDSIERLRVVELAGVVILRGRTTNAAAAEALGRRVVEMGHTRVANLIQIVENDDARIARAAERVLSMHRALDGCHFRVRADRGVVHLGGTVAHELQKDVALQVLRSINGVRSVELSLNRF